LGVRACAVILYAGKKMTVLDPRRPGSGCDLIATVCVEKCECADYP
jgi:hypothetical protein